MDTRKNFENLNEEERETLENSLRIGAEKSGRSHIQDVSCIYTDHEKDN